MKYKLDKIQQKTRVFFGLEGKSEVGLITYIEKTSGSNITAKKVNLKGSSNKVMLDEAIKKRNVEIKIHGQFKKSYLVLDSDKLGQEGNLTETELRVRCNDNNFELILLRPNFEGLILKLFEKHQHTDVSTFNNTENELKKIWAEYYKGIDSVHLAKKFSKEDLVNSSQYCGELGQLLNIFSIP